MFQHRGIHTLKWATIKGKNILVIFILWSGILDSDRMQNIISAYVYKGK